MNNNESRNTFKKVICVMTISMTVTGILFIPQLIVSRVKLSKTQENESVDVATTDLVPTQNTVSLPKTTSRSSTEVRNSANVSEKENVKEEKKAEVKEETKNKTNESKKENAKKEDSKKVVKETKKVETSKKSNTKKEDIKKEETKKEEKKESKKKKNKDSEKSEKTEQTKNSSKNDTKKTTEKKDSSEKETTNKKDNKNSTTKTVSISKVKISKDMNLTKRTGLSREDFIKLMSGVKADTSGFFKKNAGKIYDLCAKYSINEIFFCGLISAESGWNIASNHRKTHNYISLMRNGKLISFSSVNEGLEVAAQKLHYNYLTPGGKFYHGKTLAGVKVCFCPSSSWVGLVYGRMRQII